MLLPLLALSLLATTARPAPAQGTAQDLRYPSGTLNLAGELLLPATDRPAPAAVLLQGSGDSDRSNGWAAAIARELRDLGVVVLLTDKRGCGASEGDWHTATFEDLADDALAGVAALCARPEVDPERVGVVGLSQGGWVAPVAAARSRRVAFVIDVSGAAVSFAEQSLHEIANTARQAGLDPAGVAEIVALNQLAFRFVAAGEWEPYARARTAALDGAAAKVAAGFPDGREHPTWTFVRGVATFSPLSYWTAVTVPTLVVYGSEDEHDNLPVAESVRRLQCAFRLAGKTDARIEVLAGAGHGLIDLEARALRNDFLELLAGWVTETLEP